MPNAVKSFVKAISIWRTRKKLLAVYMLTGIIPMLCLGILLITNTRNQVVRQYGSQLESENMRVKIIMFDATFLASNISEILFFDHQLQGMMTKQYSTDSEVYAAYREYKLFDTYLSTYTELSGITVYVNNKTMLPYGHFKRITDDVKATDWYQKAAGGPYQIFWMVNKSLSKDGSLYLVRKMPTDYKGDFAIMVIGISNNFLKLLINNSSLHSFASLSAGNVFFSGSEAEVGKPAPIQMGEALRQSVQTYKAQYQGQQVLYAGCTLTPINTSTQLQIVTIDTDALRLTREATTLIVSIVGIALVVPIVIILLFTSRYSHRIETLRREMHKVAGGDFNVTDSIAGKDELSDVFSDIKVMIECIRNLYKEIYNEKLTKEQLATRQQRIEFEMLASQINPHFLFNTLETMRMRAILNGDREVAHIAKLLGKSMRHVLEVGPNPVPLSSELEYIRIYIEIQAFRFRDKINSRIFVEECIDADRYFILPLLLQPIVENAIVHGLESKDGCGSVEIDVRRDAQELIFSVTDDGIGIKEDDCIVLRQKLNNPGGVSAKSSIGLINVHQRIKLFYGPAYGLEVQSRRGEGTVVMIRLPFNEKGGDDA